MNYLFHKNKISVINFLVFCENVIDLSNILILSDFISDIRFSNILFYCLNPICAKYQEQTNFIFDQNISCSIQIGPFFHYRIIIYESRHFSFIQKW